MARRGDDALPDDAASTASDWTKASGMAGNRFEVYLVTLDPTVGSEIKIGRGRVW